MVRVRAGEFHIKNTTAFDFLTHCPDWALVGGAALLSVRLINTNNGASHGALPISA